MIKKIKKFLYDEFILPVRNQWYIGKERRALKKAIKYADFLSETNNGKKHIVLKNYAGNYQVINKDDFKLFRLPRRGRIDRTTTWQDLLNSCAYETKNSKI